MLKIIDKAGKVLYEIGDEDSAPRKIEDKIEETEEEKKERELKEKEEKRDVAVKV